MRIHKLIPFVAAIVFMACKKDKTTSTTETEDCTVVRGTSSGMLVEGQYIVAYNPGTGSRSSAKSMEALGSAILEQHDIRTSAIQSSFGGDMGGFVAKLTSDEANALRNDPSVGFVEQDRIIALG